MAKTGRPDVFPGAEVMTSDGASLGSVADVRDTAFKVDVRMARDYWLGRDYVIESDAGHVTMGFSRPDLKAYKLGDPGRTQMTDPAQEPSVDMAIPADQQMEQRRRMEEQLERQRRGLPPDDTGTV
jgi:hypothetical protein